MTSSHPTRPSADAPHFEVFFDGDCPLCAGEISLLRRLDRRGRVRFTDIAADGFDPAAVNRTMDELMGSIHGRILVAPEAGPADWTGGWWVEGVEVFRQLYSAVGFGPLVAVSRLPGISRALDAGYQLFARNRLRVTGRCEPGGACRIGDEPAKAGSSAGARAALLLVSLLLIAPLSGCATTSAAPELGYGPAPDQAAPEAPVEARSPSPAPSSSSSPFRAVVAVVPGCPSEVDGAASRCQWARAAWAAELYDDGKADLFIVSGGAVHTPYYESKGIAAAMRTLGVPAERVLTETQALHTDENMAYSVEIAERLGASRLVSASGRGQAAGMCMMARHWGWDCTVEAMDMPRVRARLDNRPEQQVHTMSSPNWVPRSEQRKELVRSGQSGPRVDSGTMYLLMALRGTFGGVNERPRPPQPEPTFVMPPDRVWPRAVAASMR